MKRAFVSLRRNRLLGLIGFAGGIASATALSLGMMRFSPAKRKARSVPGGVNEYTGDYLMSTTAESQTYTATGILFQRGFRPSKIAKAPDGGVFTSWLGPNGEMKVSLRTSGGETRIFTEEFVTNGTLSIAKPNTNSAFDMLHLAAANGTKINWSDEEITEDEEGFLHTEI